ncbi:unnamed protein product [Fusarium graminearum]|uniref:Uncharacterized protein n=1 Tax=Gibberella zeae TaxID=5518 RepID=A0A9N8RRE8_GIBZA|nr:unnamed protein product [Fusarium graminearum]
MNFRRDFQFDPFSEEATQFGNQDDLSNIDWSNPMEFMKSLGGLMPEFATPAKVRKEAREYSSNIFMDWQDTPTTTPDSSQGMASNVGISSP